MPARLRVLLAPSALADLEEMVSWYGDQGVPAVGERFVHEILALAEELARNPDMGRIVPEFGVPFLRELIHPPFRIVYRRLRREIQIVRVWRSERLLRLDGEPPTMAHDSTGQGGHGFGKAKRGKRSAGA